jgi:hypothetical protein
MGNSIYSIAVCRLNQAWLWISMFESLHSEQILEKVSSHV